MESYSFATIPADQQKLEMIFLEKRSAINLNYAKSSYA